jgi:hypothetical protein
LHSLRYTLLTSLGLSAAVACTPKAPTTTADDGASPGSGGAPVKGDGGTSGGPRVAPARTGYVRELNGTAHRASGGTCSAAIERGSCDDPGERASACKTDSECTDQEHGKCIQDSGMVGPFCRCEYACDGDADCKAGEACVCGDALGAGAHSRCAPAGCMSDAECASGTCGVSRYFNGCFERVVLACRTAADTCASDRDCERGTVCAVAEDDPQRKWTCQGLTCVIGRPLLVEGAARTAPAADRDDWLADLEMEAEVPHEVAIALAERWTQIAALEHASVASFARFTLELLSLAAPPELVADAQRAALDEIEHARLAWSMATLWSGRELGPGPLDLSGATAVRDLDGIVAALVKEGCVGETLGVAEARMMAELAEHPMLAQVHHQIADDEQRHAALAWRTLGWLLERYGTRARIAAIVAAAEVEAEVFAAPAEPEFEVIAPAWGLFGAEGCAGHRREAWREVVRPMLDALLGARAAA